MLLLILFAAAEPTGSSTDTGTLLLGVAAILAALMPGLLALRRRRGDTTGDDSDLAAALQRRIQVKDDTIADLQAELDRCREAGRLSAAEAHVATARIGQLEALLAMEKEARRQAQRDLDIARGS